MIVLLRLQHLLPRSVKFHYCSPAENEFYDRAERCGCSEAHGDRNGRLPISRTKSPLGNRGSLASEATWS